MQRSAKGLKLERRNELFRRLLIILQTVKKQDLFGPKARHLKFQDCKSASFRDLRASENHFTKGAEY